MAPSCRISDRPSSYGGRAGPEGAGATASGPISSSSRPGTRTLLDTSEDWPSSCRSTSGSTPASAYLGSEERIRCVRGGRARARVRHPRPAKIRLAPPPEPEQLSLTSSRISSWGVHPLTPSEITCLIVDETRSSERACGCRCRAPPHIGHRRGVRRCHAVALGSRKPDVVSWTWHARDGRARGDEDPDGKGPESPC